MTTSVLDGLVRPVSRVASRRLGRSQREALTGLLWISPWLIGFLIFTAGPMAVSLYTSLTRYTLGRTATFIGLGNYVKAITADPLSSGRPSAARCCSPR